MIRSFNLGMCGNPNCGRLVALNFETETKSCHDCGSLVQPVGQVVVSRPQYDNGYVPNQITDVG